MTLKQLKRLKPGDVVRVDNWHLVVLEPSTRLTNIGDAVRVIVPANKTRLRPEYLDWLTKHFVKKARRVA